MSTPSIPSSSIGFSFLPTALGVSAGVFFALIVLVGIFVIIVVANKADADPSGQRPLSVYLFGISFFAVFGALFGSFAIVLGLVQLIGTHEGVSGISQHPIGDAVVRSVVLAGLIFVIAMGLLLTHLPRGIHLTDWALGQPSAAGRVGRSYVASVSFVALLIAAVATVAFVYQACRILAPGVFELSSTRIVAARTLIALLYLALAAGAIVLTHLRLLPPRSGVLTSPQGVGPPPPVTPTQPPAVTQ